MADLIVSGYDDSTGQRKQAEPGDTLVDNSGNPISIGQSPTILGSASSINLTTPGTTTLYTVPSTNKAIITTAYIQLTAVSGLSAHGQYIIRNSPNSRTFLTAQTPSNGFGAVDAVYPLFNGSTSNNDLDIALADDIIVFDVNSSATAGTLTATVYLLGFLI